MSNFSELALSRIEMKKVNRGDCMPAHYDCYIGNTFSACMLTYTAAYKFIHTASTTETTSMVYNSGTC